LVDSESKVIKKSLKICERIFREGNNVVYSQNGRGNNWALGYSKTYKEQHNKQLFNGESLTLSESAMQMIQKQAEKADNFRGILLFHSLAGGTGSGLGCRLIEDYRDNYSSKKYLFTVSVWPATSGETPLQQYNTCLSLSGLQ